MKSKKYFFGLVTVVSCLSFSHQAAAEVRYLRSSGKQLIEVPQEEVQGVCGKKFVYRDINKGEVLPYLHQEIVKASLLEQMVNDLGPLRTKLLNRDGHCTWVTVEELVKVKGV